MIFLDTSSTISSIAEKGKTWIHILPEGIFAYVNIQKSTEIRTLLSVITFQHINHYTARASKFTSSGLPKQPPSSIDIA